jgi:hypothetical protein
MIIRLILIAFFSGSSAICYLAGLTRLMSGLLVGFGSLVSLFFGILFLLPAENRNLWFPLHGDGVVWPFMLLAIIMLALAILILAGKMKSTETERVNREHFQYLIGAVFAYILNVFISAYFWFPSEAKRRAADESIILTSVYIGNVIFIAGIIISLFLFYKSSQGAYPGYPDLMRRLILALFSALHFDKFPAFIAFLLVYSPETQIIYPYGAALALSAYIPVGLFLFFLSGEKENLNQS